MCSCEIHNPVLSELEENGVYTFTPNKWNEHECFLQDLLEKKIIISLSDLGIKFMNNEYIYVQVKDKDNINIKFNKTKTQSWVEVVK